MVRDSFVLTIANWVTWLKVVATKKGKNQGNEQPRLPYPQVIWCFPLSSFQKSMKGM